MDEYLCECGHDYDDHTVHGEGAGCSRCECELFSVADA